MDILISFYDNFLIYYPNIFFAAFFLVVFISGIFFLHIVQKILDTHIIREIKKYRIYVSSYQIKKRKIRIKSYMIILVLYVIHRGYQWIAFIEIQAEKIIKRIAKEILIDEKK